MDNSRRKRFFKSLLVIGSMGIVLLIGSHVGYSVVNHLMMPPADRMDLSTVSSLTDSEIYPQPLEPGDLLPAISSRELGAVESNLRDEARGAVTLFIFLEKSCGPCDRLREYLIDTANFSIPRRVSLVLAVPEGESLGNTAQRWNTLLPKIVTYDAKTMATCCALTEIPTLLIVDESGFIQGMQVGFSHSLETEFRYTLRSYTD